MLDGQRDQFFHLQHFIPGIAPNDPRTQLRLRFHAFLRGITGRYRVDVICEEAKHGKESIAESLANSEGIRYRNIEMSLDRRAELGIPPPYSIDLPGSEYSREQKGQWNDQREAYMLYALSDQFDGVARLCGKSTEASWLRPSAACHI